MVFFSRGRLIQALPLLSCCPNLQLLEVGIQNERWDEEEEEDDVLSVDVSIDSKPQHLCFRGAPFWTIPVTFFRNVTAFAFRDQQCVRNSTTVVYDSLVQWLQCMPQLEHLVLEDFHFLEGDAEQSQAHGMIRLHALRELRLERVEAKSVRALCSIAEMPELQSLAVEFAFLRLREAQHDSVLLDMTSRVPRLRKLHIANGIMQRDSWVAVLGTWKSLAHLHLASCVFDTDTGSIGIPFQTKIACLPEVLSANPALEHLRLDNQSELTSPVIKAITTILHLQSLEIRGVYSDYMGSGDLREIQRSVGRFVLEAMNIGARLRSPSRGASEPNSESDHPSERSASSFWDSGDEDVVMQANDGE